MADSDQIDKVITVDSVKKELKKEEECLFKIKEMLQTQLRILKASRAIHVVTLVWLCFCCEGSGTARLVLTSFDGDNS